MRRGALAFGNGLAVLAAAAAFAAAGAPAALADEIPAVEPLGAQQEIGARLGLQLDAAGPAAGGARVAGVYLYKLSAESWFDGEAAVAFGSSARQCFIDRSLTTVCTPGLVSGFGFSVQGGARWFPVPPRPSGFNPYLRAALGLEVDSFSGDGVTGLGIPLSAAGGGRFRVAKNVAVGGEAVLSVGPVFYDHGVGGQAAVRLVVQGTVDMGL
jgi:hypothetical protein